MTFHDDEEKDKEGGELSEDALDEVLSEDEDEDENLSEGDSEEEKE